MLCFADGDTLPLWVLIYERIGPGSCILVFTGAVLWKLLPASIRLIGARKKQADELTRAVPIALGHLGELVGHGERIANHLTRSSPTGEGGADLRLHRASANPGTVRGSRHVSSEDES